MELLMNKKLVTEEIKRKLTEFNIKAMETYKTSERQFVKPAINENKFIRQLKVIGVTEKNEIFPNERLLKDKQTIQNLAEKTGDQLATEDCF